MRKILRIGAISFAALLVLALLSLIGGWWGAKQVPEFYQQALEVEPQRHAELGDKLEENLLELRNEASQEGQWQAVFTDEQINGWLASDLPEKFPRALPPEVKEPRVAIEPEVARVGARFKSPQLETVISLAVEVHMTDEPNVLAVRIRQARAGLLPVPLADWLEQVRLAAGESGIPLRWVEQDGDPVALVTIPMEQAGRDHRLLLEQIELRDGELVVGGRTERFDAPPSARDEAGFPLHYSAANHKVHR
jgi:hypothetical protein